MKYLFILISCISLNIGVAQELFIVTDPASNVPANSLSIRMSNSYFKEVFKEGYNYHLMPEITYGLTKNLMLRTSAFVSNRSSNLYVEGVGIYAKYRFFSVDDIHSHFRLAAFGRYSLNRADIHQEQIEIMGHNTGFEAGMVATKLIDKIALSASFSIEKAMNNNPDYIFPAGQGNLGSNYTFSVGRLMYPKKYQNLNQTNINIMIEFIGQTLNQNNKSFLDIVPSVQFIINSQSRLDFAYRKQLYNNMIRTAPNGVYLNFEYTFFNITH